VAPGLIGLAERGREMTLYLFERSVPCGETHDDGCQHFGRVGVGRGAVDVAGACGGTSS
jgi:hypothetical protein